MKKFLSMMLLAVGIIFGTQLAAVKTAHAELVYAFSYDGADYYIDTERSDFGTELFSTLPRCFRGSTEVYGYIQQIVLLNGFGAAKWVCTFYLADGRFIPVDDISTATSVWGNFARSVLNIYQNNLEKIQAQIEQHNREVEARKRREEEARKNKFDSLIAAGNQAYSAKDYPAAVQSYESARKLDKSTVDKFISELVKNGDKLNSQDNSSNQDKLFFPRLLWENFSEAANFYRTMTTIRPDYFHYWYMLGWMLDELKDYDGAIAAYTRSAELNPTEIIYKYRGGAYKNSLRYDEAIADYKKALEFRPDYKDALDELWDAYCETGKFDDAADFYNKRVTANPKDSDSWFRLALSLNEQKKFRDAITAMCLFIDCLTDDSSSADGWYWLARIHQNAGETKKAVDACKKALKLDPKHADAKKLLDQLSG